MWVVEVTNPAVTTFPQGTSRAFETLEGTMMSHQTNPAPASELPTGHRSGPIIEQHSIDYVHRAERRGKVWHQGALLVRGEFCSSNAGRGIHGPRDGP